MSLVAALLAAGTVAVFAPALDGAFITNYDDQAYITGNPMVQRGLTLEGVRWALTTGTAANWHPLTWMSHMLDVSLFGLDPWGHHLTSLLLHAFNAALLFLLLASFPRRQALPWGVAWVAAALFAWHPLRVESVAWVAERKDVLCATFWLLGLGCYLRYVRVADAASVGWRRWYALTLTCFALGLTAKPMIVTFPFVLLLLDAWPLQRAMRRRLLLEKLPMFAMSLVSCAVTAFVQARGGAVQSVQFYPLGVRLENALRAWALYLRKLFWPGELSFYYPHPGADIATWQWLGASLLLVAVTGWVVSRWRREPYLAVGWLWFCGTLVPVIGLVQVGAQGLADRYTYVPHIGLLLALAAWGAARVASLRPGQRWVRQVLAAGCVAVLLACAGRTRAEIRWWRDDVTLYGRALAIEESNAFAHFNLGGAWLGRGETARAISHLRRAVELVSIDREARTSLGVALALQGDLPASIAELQAAVALDPSHAPGWNNLGRVLEKAGHGADAAACYREALRLDPGFDLARANLEGQVTRLREDATARQARGK